ncbi:probable RNA-binding protein CG14230 [Aricia agestis]|uniref:probable RNA-binding protein CG14230 n=1 Tax=Aricia agestis TaxID=91739 RepID=UPI001C204871|nr:probable RNA-binding protein CG14230 [Aricia agestis]
MAFTTRLFVGNIPEKVTEDALRKEFSIYGDVTNIDIKTKPGAENDKKVFAFVTLSANNYNVESCIKKFSEQDCFGQRLYVTRARESFLERLQREREQTQQKNSTNSQDVQETSPSIHKPVKNHINNMNKKRKFAEDENFDDYKELKTEIPRKEVYKPKLQNGDIKHVQNVQQDSKKLDSDQKRLESIKRKRQEFNQKKNIIKTGLISIDKQANKKVIFSDAEDDTTEDNNKYLNVTNKEASSSKRKDLFDDNESDDETNFDMKKQFEGKKGQKVLELQSRYKADKRFTLDERFVDDESDNDNQGEEAVDLGQVDEKSKQLNILQDVLGVTIKTKSSDDKDKMKAKPGMLRFDPSKPDHSKFLAPMEQKPESKKAKKKKNKELQEEVQEQPEIVVEKVEVSKDQFYKVSDTLKEAMAEPKEFSLRSLFANDNNEEEDTTEQSADYISLQSNKDKKVRNPLDPGEKNPFVYDSSESEDEEEKTIKETKTDVQNVEPKAVWRENFFFSENDDRLKDGLLFFTQKIESEPTKDRRELKSLMKKRIYNKERKNQMFKKKIGGRKKSMKKSFRKKS